MGASLKDAPSVKNVVKILQQHAADKTIIIVSAMGKTTNALEAVVAAHARKDGNAFQLLEQVKKTPL